MVILRMNYSIGEGHRIIFISIGFTFGQSKINVNVNDEYVLSECK